MVACEAPGAPESPWDGFVSGTDRHHWGVVVHPSLQAGQVSWLDVGGQGPRKVSWWPEPGPYSRAVAASGRVHRAILIIYNAVYPGKPNMCQAAQMSTGGQAPWRVGSLPACTLAVLGLWLSGVATSPAMSIAQKLLPHLAAPHLHSCDLLTWRSEILSV